MKILRYDDDLIDNMKAIGTYDEYLLDRANYGSIFYKTKLDPTDGWATPFVTGHKYKVHWGITGIDFTQMQLSLSERWTKDDKDIYFVHNFTDIREEIKVTVDGDELV